jgi:hypothetical protein
MPIRQYYGRHIATTRERHGCAMVPGMTAYGDRLNKKYPTDLPSTGDFEAPGTVVL